VNSKNESRSLITISYVLQVNRLITMKRLLFISIQTILCVVGLNAQQTNDINSIIIKENNLSGGGFQSDVTITNNGQTVYSSADVSGISKSTDGGRSYVSINEGLKSPKVASLAVTPDNDQIIYAGTGDKGGSGGLFRSTNGGDTWVLTEMGNNAQFAGNHSDNNDPVPNGHPRSNGDLIVVKEGLVINSFIDDVVIAGSYKNGVVIFTEGGDVRASVVEPNGFVRAVAYNPAKADTAYAAIQFWNGIQDMKNGIYEIDFSNPFMPKSTLVYYTPQPESICILESGNVYAAIGKAGIAKYDKNSWTLVNSGLDTNNPLRQWSAVTGYLKGTKDVIYAAVNNLGGNANGTPYSSVWRSKDGGVIWADLINSNSIISHQIYGQTYDWWYSTKAFPPATIGGTNSVVSSIDVDQGDKPLSIFDDIIYVSGRGGIWKSENNGNLWQPAVFNMQVTSNNGVAVNPNNSSQIALANTDYVVMETSDSFNNGNVSRDKPSGSESKAYDIIFDSNSDDVIVGVGSRDNNVGGEVYTKASSDLGNLNQTWHNTMLQSVTNGRVRAVAYGYHNGVQNTDRIILAAVENEGVYRHHNGQWLPANNIDINATKRSNFVWPDNTNSGVVYLLDLSTGLHRSIDGGINWENMWPCMKFNNKDFFNTGYITADDNDVSTLFISMQGGSCIPADPNVTKFNVYRLTNADTKIFQAPGTAHISNITTHSGNLPIKRPGPIVCSHDGKLWLTEQSDSQNGITSALYVMQNPHNDMSFIDVTTNKYRNTVISPSGIDVSNDGHIYISQNGSGLVKIQYTGPPQIGLSNACIEVYPELESSLYTISGILSGFNIDILDVNRNTYSSLPTNLPTVSFDVNSLPSGTFFIRVSDPNNNQLHLEKIIKF